MKTWNVFPWRRHEMKCRLAVELVTDYLEGALPRKERAGYEGHLAECPGCLAYLGQMKATVGMLGHLEPSSLPTEVRDDLIRIFEQFHNMDL